MKLVYIAGPFSGKTGWDIEQNIRAVEALGFHVAQLGAYPVMPHANTRGYWCDVAPYEFWIEATLELMRRCDAVLLTPDWESSKGASGEVAEALARRIPVFDTVSELRDWLGEVKP